MIVPIGRQHSETIETAGTGLITNELGITTTKNAVSSLESSSIAPTYLRKDPE